MTTGKKKSRLASNEVGVSEFLPYKLHWSNDAIIMKDDSMMQVIKLGGYSFETADDEDLDINKSSRNQLFRSVATGSCSLYFHVIRSKQNPFEDEFGAGNTGKFFVDYLANQWRNKHAKKSSFSNELYLTIIIKSANSGVKGVFNWFNRVGQNSSSKEAFFIDMYEEISEISSRMISSLSSYFPRLLTVKQKEDSKICEISSFLSKLVNFGSEHHPEALLSDLNISDYLPTNRLYFGHKSIEILTPVGSKYAGIVSLKEYGQSTSAGMLDSFLQIPFELVVTQSFSFTNRQVAINKMQIQQNRMIQSEDKAISQIAEITKALDSAMSGSIAFGEHHLTIMGVETSLSRLDTAMSSIETELANTGAYPVREKINLEPAFWTQMPGNFDFIVRKAIISTLNLAGFVSLHNYPLGKKQGNHLGEAVTVFDTTSGTPFFFNFHVRDVGHTTIIGPTGAGKTVLMNFLCSQAMKHKMRMFFFDKDRGAEIFVRAIGGVYTAIEANQASHFNPLQLDDTPSNRVFFKEWFEQMLSVSGQQTSPEDIEVINQAIKGNFKLNKEDRVLHNLAPFFGMGGPGTIANRIQMWHDQGTHASFFDNKEDKLDLDVSSVFGFEMGAVLQDSSALGPILLYLFHRISISLDGRPCMIVLDEAWALIDNPVFAPKIKDWLKVLRKLNTFVIFATQSVEDASKSAISDTLIQQTATQIFLPNLKATNAYRDIFMLSEREFVIIKHTNPSSRFFLVKQDNKAVVARISLDGMSDIISVLSGRADTVDLLHKVLEEAGDNPSEWLPVFFKKANNV